METRKLYICQPFNDVTEEDYNMVRKTILDMVNDCILEGDKPYELLDIKAGVNPEKTDEEYHVVLLSEALNQMRKADAIMFAPGWNKSEYCVVLHLACELYPFLNEKAFDFEDVFL